MSLMYGLTLRLMGIGLVCLCLAVAWIVVDTNRQVGEETASTALRVARQLERFHLWSERDRLLGTNDYLAMTLAPVMSPGVCVDYDGPRLETRRQCSGWSGLGSISPAWFRKAFHLVFKAGVPVSQSVALIGKAPRAVVARFDPVAATTRAWHQFRVVAGMAAAMALGMSLFAIGIIAHAVRPTRTIIRGLRRLESGDHESRLPDFAVTEYRRIAGAFNDLAERLQRTTAERTALTLKLIRVQEEERRSLARELHDEFGQCLTATGALAASLACAAPKDRPDIAEDAAAIARITAEMMAVLKGAFARLRPPDLEELGLAASLRTMVRGWNDNRAVAAKFHLEIEGDLSGVSPDAALDIYRIAQECITNAARHGSPSRVTVRVRRGAADPAQSPGGLEADSVALVVDDDGGGRPEQVATTTGFGLVGIRERIGALGGTLTIGQAEGGVRMSALIPAGRRLGTQASDPERSTAPAAAAA